MNKKKGIIIAAVIAVVLAAALVFFYYRRMCVKDFGGLSGDLAGWFLQTAELWMLLALVARQWLPL